MNVKRAYENFKSLKEDVEKDGKIDMFEVKVLLKFMTPYCRKNRKEFIKVREILLRVCENGSMTKADAISVIEGLYEILRCLRREYAIERTLNYLIAFAALVSAFYYVFYC